MTIIQINAQKSIQNQLMKLQDVSYAEFQSKLTPGIPQESFIGVRIPLLRKFAKVYYKDPDHIDFMTILPHQYYDENMLHGLLIEQINNYDECIQALDLFLPFVDNWAVCDIVSPSVFKKNKHLLINQIKLWIESNHVYTIRFGLEMLMRYFLDQDFQSHFLSLAASISSNEYYVNMMISWLFATALSKQWKDAIVYLEEAKLSTWVHNKTIQKAVESYRITDIQKTYLRTLKRVSK